MKQSHTRIIEGILQKTIACKNFVVQDFFVGLTNDPNKRLFKEHKVDERGGLYVYFEASSNEEAKKAFNELMELDMNGAPLPGCEPGKYVYCYHINGLTIECPLCN